MSATPRHHTPRDERYRTLGGKAARLAAILGVPYMPWQRRAADVALELDERGRFRYHTVVISVPRQAGKTTETLTLGLHRMMTTPGGKSGTPHSLARPRANAFCKSSRPRCRSHYRA